MPMMDAIASLNYVALLAVTVVGFMIGWLWYSPVLFAKAWIAEMKFTEESMKEAARKGMAGYFIRGFLYTLLGTFGLAVLINAHGSTGALAGVKFGLFVGVTIAGGRLLNASVWENRSMRLMGITLGHEVVLFIVQGAILGVWR